MITSQSIPRPGHLRLRAGRQPDLDADPGQVDRANFNAGVDGDLVTVPLGVQPEDHAAGHRDRMPAAHDFQVVLAIAGDRGGLAATDDPLFRDPRVLNDKGGHGHGDCSGYNSETPSTTCHRTFQFAEQEFYGRNGMRKHARFPYHPGSRIKLSKTCPDFKRAESRPISGLPHSRSHGCASPGSDIATPLHQAALSTRARSNMRTPPSRTSAA